MRTFTLALVATAAFGLATTALAQSASNNVTFEPSTMQPTPPQGSGEFLNTGSGFSTSVDAAYMIRLSMIQRAATRQTHEDGGRLTPQHEASLQKELDALNRHFRMTVASR